MAVMPMVVIGKLLNIPSNTKLPTIKLTTVAITSYFTPLGHRHCNNTING